MNINAVITQVQGGFLLVNDLSHNQEVLVRYRNTRGFSVGDYVRIAFDGRMTGSIPPQITARSIQRIPRPTPAPPLSGTEMRGAVVRVCPGCLMIRTQNNGLVRVMYPGARNFRPGHRVAVWYDTITFGNPPVVTATAINQLL